MRRINKKIPDSDPLEYNAIEDAVRALLVEIAIEANNITPESEFKVHAPTFAANFNGLILKAIAELTAQAHELREAAKETYEERRLLT